MIRLPPTSTRPDTRLPYPTLFRSLQEREAGAIGERSFGEARLFGRHLDGVAVERRLDRDAIFDRPLGRRALLRKVERLGEVEVAGLVMRRGGLGDVRGEHHHELAAELMRRSVQDEVNGQTDGAGTGGEGGVSLGGGGLK